MSFRDALVSWIDGRDVSRESTESLLGDLMDGRLSEVEKAALLIALATKGESADEIAGAAAAMRARATRIPHRLDVVVDTCGTGGDGLATFNISTASALVAAAAGVKVAKHGNRSVSSRSGSADVLAELGVSLELSPAQVGGCLEAVGIGFLFAPGLHPAMKEVMPVRKELGVRTLFNVLGPLTNPAGARRQLLGVFSADLVPKLGRVLAELGCDHALVVHGSDGLDEITTTGPTEVAEVRGERVETWTLDPADYGVERQTPETLAGGDPATNAALMRSLLAGEASRLTDVVALNAGAAIYVGAQAPDLESGVEVARDTLRSGAAAATLDELVSFSERQN